MKILTKKKVNEIDILTTSIHNFINNLSNDSIKKPFEKIDAIHKLNEVRGISGLPRIITIPPRRIPHMLLSEFNISMPPVKPCKMPEHEHDFFIAHQTKTVSTICCRTCGKTKRIEADIPQEKVTPEYIKISIDDFKLICNESTTANEVRTKIFRLHNSAQEDKQ